MDRVLDECINRLEQVDLLPAVLAHLDDLSGELGEEVTQALRVHQLFEERLESLESAPWSEAVEREAVRVETGFQNSLRDVLRLFRDQPAAKRVLLRGKSGLEGPPGGGEGVQGLLRGMKELKEVVQETSPAEERIQDVSQTELVSSLEADVAAAVKDRDTEIAKMDEVIKQLKSSLHQMEKTSEEIVWKMQQDAEKRVQSDRKTSEGKQVRMQQEANQLRVKLSSLRAENWEAETALRKKKNKMETEIENFIQKYDADMREKQLELDDMMKEFKEEKKELQQLEDNYAVLEVEFNQIQEERRLAEERREEQRRLLEVQDRASTLIQALWRGYCVRKMMKTKGKGKKGNKGKKGRKGNKSK